MAEEVTAAANEVISTNFTIAKTIATSPSLSQAETNGVTPVMPQPAIAETAASAAPSLAAAISRPAGAPQRPLQPGRAADDTSTVIPTDSAASPAADAAHAAKPSGPTHSASVAPEDARENDADGISLGSKTASGHTSAHLAAQPQTGADTPDFSASLAGSQLGPQTAPLTHTAAAQPMVTVAANHAVPIEGLAVQIALNAQGGRSRFEIRLDPAELGRIDVRLDVDRHGQVTSHLTVEKPETLALLRQDAPQLQRALEDAGLKTGSNGLQFSLRDQSFADRDQSGGSERQPHRLIISDTAPASASGSGRTVYPYAAASLSGGIDIRV